MKLKYADLHSPLFLGGKNFGLKLDPSRFHGLELTYDRDNKELLINWSKQKAIIPISNVACMVEDDGLSAPKKVHNASGKPIKAQASLPPGMREE